MPGKQQIVALEEHFWIPSLRDTYAGNNDIRPPHAVERLGDLGEVRLREMDEAGINFQVISHVQPGVQMLEPERAIVLAREANDILHEAVVANPDRFAGFAAIPTSDPAAAADELERTVTQYGFKGAMINGLTNGSFIDEKKFWCIFERAQALGVPIYIHPADPHPAVIEAYYKDYPTMVGAVWGFTVEAATQGIRLILSGVFDRYPDLKIILGHLGETLPFALWRVDAVFKHTPGGPDLKRDFADYFRECFYITTAGNFSHPALICCIMELGIERILFSVDWPYMTNTDGIKFIDTAPISEQDKQKILRENVRNVLKL